jgi:hypothetical protein
MSQGVFTGAYMEGFVARLERVYGLDYSPGMLAAFEEQPRLRGVANVTSILRACPGGRAPMRWAIVSWETRGDLTAK